MKTIICIITLFLFHSCEKLPGVSNIALTPESSVYSEKNNLLVDRYTFSKDTINILGNNYIIADAWVSHNFVNRFSKEINLEYLIFFCSFKNINTNQYFIDQTNGGVYNVLDNNVENRIGHGFHGLGKKYSHYSISFKDTNVKKLPDTIKIYVKSNKDTIELDFYKYSNIQ